MCGSNAAGHGQTRSAGHRKEKEMEWMKQIANVANREAIAALALTGALTVATAVPAYAMHEITFGTSGPDNLRGTSGSDDLRGLGGNDDLRSFRGNDILRGGYGSDYANGAGGNDYVYGGPGNDLSVEGGPGSDHVFGGSGDDYIGEGYYGGVDRIYGGYGNDTIHAHDQTSAADIIDCGPGFDRVTVNGDYNSTKDVVAANCEKVIPDRNGFVF